MPSPCRFDSLQLTAAGKGQSSQMWARGRAKVHRALQSPGVLGASALTLPSWLGSSRLGARTAAAAASASPIGPAVLLVESPAKASKIQEYLGDAYRVLASYGHVRDLSSKAGSVLPDEGFLMRWELSKGARPRLNQIASAVSSAAGRVLLATDPDREGEAISWHLLQELQARGVLDANAPPQRVTFTEVTKQAVLDAIAAPRPLSEPLVDAYLARRALDYLFGYNLSSLLWRKVPAARSAGRVQSAALRIVTEREAAIEAFRPLQYWKVAAQVVLPGDFGAVEAALTAVDGAPPPKPGFASADAAAEVAARVAAAEFSVAGVSSKDVRRQPPPPFTTSTLQQEASRRLGLGSTRTMQLAQKLYEGGHITYMRTDGVSLAPAALHALRTAAQAAHGEAYVPQQPRFYKTRTKNAQESHEAIRPTNPQLHPDALGRMGYEPQAVQLYRLVQARSLASQMASAQVQQAGADFVSADGTLMLRSTGSHLLFPGYLAAYGATHAAVLSREVLNNGTDGDSSAAAAAGKQSAATAAALACLQRGSAVVVESSDASQHETRPPGRFTEGTLVKALEEQGIGRPSTYAPTIKLLASRKYVRKEGRALHAEPLGRVLSAFLSAYFDKYVDLGFTSKMEGQLDEITGGEGAWQDLVRDFWQPFQEQLAEVKDVTGTEVIDRLNQDLHAMLFGPEAEQALVGAHQATSSVEAGESDSSPDGSSSSSHGGGGGSMCPACGEPLSLKMSHKAGPFVGCTSYPACPYTRSIAPDVYAAFNAGGEEGPGKGQKGPTGPESLSSLEVATKYGMRGSVRLLGVDPRTGKEIFVRQGPYGPYMQLGPDTDISRRRVPLPKGLSARNVQLQYALSVLALPRKLGEHTESGTTVEVRNGKFGPYVQHGSLRRSVPKELDPVRMSLEEAMGLLKSARNTPANTTYSTKRPLEDAMSEEPKRRGRKKKVPEGSEAAEAGEPTDAPPVAPGAKKPKGPKGRLSRTGYQLFLLDHMRREEYVSLTLAERMKVLGARWKEIDPAQAREYRRRGEMERQRMEVEAAGLLPAGSADWEELPSAQRKSLLSSLREQHNVVELVTGMAPRMKRPRSAYHIFMQEHSEAVRQEVAAQGLESQRGTFMNTMAKMWRTLPEPARHEYAKKAEVEQQVYQQRKQLLLDATLLAGAQRDGAD